MRDLFLEEYPGASCSTSLSGMKFRGYCFAEIPESADPIRVLKVLPAACFAPIRISDVMRG